MKDNKGAVPILILLLIVVILAVGGIGWYVWQNNKDSNSSSPQNTQEQVTEPVNTNTSEDNQATVSNQYFDLLIPKGFTENNERIFTYTAQPEKTFSYINNTNGNYFEININPAASGFSPDFVWQFTRNQEKVILQDKPTEICNPATEELCTTSGNNRLDVFIADKAGYSGSTPSYYFTFGNIKSEQVPDLAFVDTFISNLKLK